MTQDTTSSALRDRFLTWIATGRIVHALILSQPEREAREAHLRFMAGALLCSAEDPYQRPCGACRDCLLFTSRNHPDDLMLTQDQRGVDDARAIRVALAQRRWMGGRRPVRIPWADGLSVQGQNALLKTLEEPPEGTVFLLGADHADRLLPTIRSRCVVWSDGGVAAIAAEDRAAACRLLSPDPATRITAVQEIRSPGVLDALEQILAEAARARESGESPPDCARRFTIPALLVMIKATGNTRRMISGHVSWPMALTGLITTFGEIP